MEIFLQFFQFSIKISLKKIINRGGVTNTLGIQMKPLTSLKKIYV